MQSYHRLTSLVTHRAARWCFNISLLQNEQFIGQIKAQLSDLIGFIKVSVSEPRVYYYFIRSFSISFASNLNKNSLQHINKLEKKLCLIESKMHNVHSPQLPQEKEGTRVELKSFFDTELNLW